ncbi:tyrosine-type recombinase/integrase [Bradyrhizobium sp. USDA 4503]
MGSAAVVCRAAHFIRKAGISVPRAGSHVLRHSCVQRLLNANFSLKHIGDYVGHRSASSTQIYGRSPSNSCVRLHSAMGRTCCELRCTFPEFSRPRDRAIPRPQALFATALCCRREDARAVRCLLVEEQNW